MTDPLIRLVQTYKGRGLLVDTNILLLYCVGTCDPRLITTFKRTQQFTLEDFDLLRRLFNWFGTIVTTPNILTEVHNLAGQLPTDQVRMWRRQFRNRISNLSEEYLSSVQTSESPQYLNCGLTDAGVIEISRGRLLALTDDLKLFVALQSEGVDAVNFNHLRTSNWIR